MDFTSNVEGSTINVYPINNVHPTIPAANHNRVLQYYWGVTTSGISNAAGTMVFHYDSLDLRGDTTQYHSAQLRLIDDTWAKAEMPYSDKNNNHITFTISGDNPGGSFLCGEDAAIPNVISVYSTVQRRLGHTCHLEHRHRTTPGSHRCDTGTPYREHHRPPQESLPNKNQRAP
jgi:hypothetical protein